MLLALVALLASAVAGTAAIPSRAEAAEADFVRRCGIHFCLDGRDYYFAGANVYDVFTYGGSFGDTETQYMDKARIDAQFERLAAARISVLRLWMFSHEDWHGFEPQKGVYNDQEFALFDYVIESAKNHGVRLLPVFENYWEAYGGIDTRLRWEGLGTGQANRWRFFDKTACPNCFTQYKDYVSHALNRVNHYSGVAYKDDPTIFGWELMNEPRFENVSQDENVNGTTLRAWVDEMAGHVKSIDQNHLVGAGIEGHGAKYGFGGDEGNPFVHIQESPFIDFTSAHPYPTEEWANLTLEQTKELINSWISDSHDVIGKPFFMGEFNTKNVDRVTWWRELYASFEANDGDGSAFWWYPDAQNQNVDATYGVRDGAPEMAEFTAHADRQAAKSTIEQTTLRQAAQAHGRYFGSAATAGELQDSAYRTLTDRQAGMLTPGNDMKWDATEPQRGQFTFAGGDSVVASALAAGQRVRGHTLLWHNQLPTWLTGGGFGGDELRGILEDHIAAVAGHYAGQLYAWDVVNEPFNDDGTFRQTLWYTGLGEEYIAQALRAARAADPDAKLYVNDYNIEGVGAKSDAMYNLVSSLLQQGVPLDGVGIQGHIVLGQIPPTMRQNIQRFADLGLDVAITELDIRMRTPADDAALAAQAADYTAVTDACLAVSRCVGITTWGLSDRYSWIPGTFPGEGAALPFDENFQPKPAYGAVLQALGG